MSKGRNKKNLNDRTSLIQEELKIRYKNLASVIQAAKEGRLSLKELNNLKSELESSIKLSGGLVVQIAECHPSGKYKRALPKDYQSDITAIDNAISRAKMSGPPSKTLFENKVANRVTELNYIKRTVELLSNELESQNRRGQKNNENFLRRYEAVTALSDYLKSKIDFDEDVFIKTKEAMEQCIKHKPTLKEQGIINHILDKISSFLGRNKWYNFVNAQIAKEIDVKENKKPEKISNDLKLALNHFSGEGYFSRDTVLKSKGGSFFKFNCDFILKKEKDGISFFPVVKKLGQGLGGVVYQVQEEYYKVTADNIQTEKTKHQAIKLIDLKKDIKNVPFLGTLLDTSVYGMRAATNLLKGLRREDLINEVHKANLYYQRADQKEFAKMHCINVDGNAAVMMELILLEGVSLSQFLGLINPDYNRLKTVDQLIEFRSKDQELCFEDKLIISKNLTFQIRHLKEAGIIHGDLFPDNIQVFNKNVRLLDFAFSKNIKDIQSGEAKVHKTWDAFNPPEIKKDKMHLSHPEAAQVFSLGVNLQLVFGMKDSELDQQKDEGLIEMASLIKEMKNNDYRERPTLENIINRIEHIEAIMAEQSQSPSMKGRC